VIFGNTKRLLLSWTSLTLIGLALSVVGWGTGYKISLYFPPHSIVRQMPHAKLLSENEQGSSKEGSQIKSLKDTSDKNQTEAVSTLVFALLLGSIVLNHIFVPSPRERDAHRRRHVSQLACQNFFFVLPPPVLS
jgi:hypothetical protein